MTYEVYDDPSPGTRYKTKNPLPLVTSHKRITGNFGLDENKSKKISPRKIK